MLSRKNIYSNERCLYTDILKEDVCKHILLRKMYVNIYSKGRCMQLYILKEDVCKDIF